MNKLFSIFVLSALLMSCGNSGSYKIDGTVSGMEEGDTLSLGYSVDGAQYTPESYAVIKDGKFEFAGKTENCKLYYIVKQKTEEPVAMVFLENGNITVDISEEKNSITGTESNDLNMKLMEDLTAPITELQEKQMRLYMDTTLTDEQREVLLDELKTISEKASQYIKEFITANAETMVGLFMLVQYADMFDNDELDALVKRVPEKNKDTSNNCLFSVLSDIQEQRKNPQDFSEYFKSEEETEDSTNVSKTVE